MHVNFLHKYEFEVVLVVPCNSHPGSGGCLENKRLEVLVRCFENVGGFLILKPDVEALVDLEPLPDG